MRRVVVYGPSGSGKTAIAKQISEILGVPHIELDVLYWLPGWVVKPTDRIRSEVSTLLSEYPNGWVFDGNYYELRPLILPSADIVVWWRPPFRVAFWRLLKRTIVNCWSGKLLWGINRETWRHAFFSRKSILLYQVTHWRAYGRIGRNLREVQHRAKVIQLHSQKEVVSFLKELG